MKTRSKYLLWGVAGVVVIALLAFLMRPEAVRVDVAEAKRGAMAATVQDRGQTRVLDRYVVSAPVAGSLERIPLREGEAVKAGDVVARLHPASLSAVATGQVRAAVTEAEAAVNAARARVAAAQSQLEYARAEAVRVAAMHAQGIASREAFDASRNAETTARGELQAAQAAQSQAAATLASARAATLPLQSGAGVIELHAPVDSRVFAIPDRSARTVAPGEAILTLGNPRQIEAVIDVLSEEAVKVNAGDRAFLVDWGGRAPLEGTVSRIEASAFTKVSALGIEEQRVHVVVAIPDPPPSLGDAYRVQGKIVVWSSPSVLQVPVGALTRFGDRWGVWVIDGGRARKRLIEIGHRNDDAAEVLSGLEAGSPVILHPADDVADGVRVTPR